MKAFVIVTGNDGKRDFEVGQKLVLRDSIESGDYAVMNTDQFNKLFTRDLRDSADFSLRNADEIHKYRPQYLVITSDRYIVRAFIRI